MCNRVVLLFVLILTAIPTAIAGQELALNGRKPRFVAAWTLPGKVVDASNAAVLRRRVSLDISRLALVDALREIAQQANLELSYNPALLPEDKTASLRAADITVVSALTEVLLDTGLDVAVGRGGELTLIALPSRRAAAVAQDSGMVVGRVTDKETGAPIAGATVAIEGTRLSTTTNNEGAYRFARVPEGTYTVRARYIGYAPTVAPVSLTTGAEMTVDFSLERSVQQLDEVVVTGTIIPTEVKALPTPVSVISADEIAQRRPQAMQDIIRQAIPTAVAFDDPTLSPALSLFSVRGASSLNGTGAMKVFVDGVEAAGFGTSPVDPNSIERIEVVRGPQAATLYGADAAGGVVQIFTKRGEAGLTRPRVDAQAELGLVQTPYTGHGGVLRQNYTGSVRGGDRDVSYNFGGGYTRLADYLPNGELSRQSSPSLFGGTRITLGIITADLSARYYRNKLPSVINPLALTAGFGPFSRPNYTINDFTNETYGARVTLTPTVWWRNQVTLGVDRGGNRTTQTQPRVTTPDDTLYSVFDGDTRKISFAYNASVNGQLSTSVMASLTVGIDHYDQYASSFFTTQALNSEGPIITEPPGAFSVDRSTVTNTGYFAQTQVSVHDVLFVTAGLRAEDNSTFGAELGTPVSPRVGLSLVRQVGQATVKIRGSYGRAIRAPQAGFAGGSVSATSITLANPLLAPEQQRGWDAGVDLVFGSRGSLSLTGYDQTAKDLIAFVQVADMPVPTFQFLNIGRVSNRGVEVEGTLNVHPLQLKGQYGHVRSRIEDLGSAGTVSGFQVGNRPLGLPTHTAGMALTLAPRQGTTLTAGLTYVGSYRQTDFLALLRCFGGTGPCPADFDFAATFPGFTKLNASITQRIARQIDGFVSVEDLTDSRAHEGSNLLPVTGRMTMVGLHLTY